MPGFFLLLTAAALLTGLEALSALLCAAAIHELAHVIALKLLGGKAGNIKLSVAGVELNAVFPPGAPYKNELLAVAAGPAANLAIGILLSRIAGECEYLYTFAGVNMVLGVFNLLPAGRLDGGRLVRLLAEWRGGPDAGAAMLNAATIVCAALALGGGIALFFIGNGNIALLASGMYLCYQLVYDIIYTKSR